MCLSITHTNPITLASSLRPLATLVGCRYYNVTRGGSALFTWNRIEDRGAVCDVGSDYTVVEPQIIKRRTQFTT